MKIIKPNYEFLWTTPNSLQAIELAGRTCYKSEDKITNDSAEKFVQMLIDRGHEAMIEHGSMSYRVVCDRGVTHEIVRHRLFSYAQESTRYVNYKNNDMEFILPCFWDDPTTDKYLDFMSTWRSSMLSAEFMYKYLMKEGAQPQEARNVLPNSLKTEIVITGNFREWRHFFKLRTAPAAHPQMREIANLVLADAIERVPVIFDDFKGTKVVI